jgi:hypothetical protein
VRAIHPQITSSEAVGEMFSSLSGLGNGIFGTPDSQE